MPERDDDPLGIPNGTRLFRRIHPLWVIWDSNKNERRPTSQNFDNSQDGTPMSVFAENLALANGETPDQFLQGVWEEFHLAAVTAGWMRENGQAVYPDAENQPNDDRFESHAAVRGAKKEKTRKKLAERYEWIIAPDDRFTPP